MFRKDVINTEASDLESLQVNFYSAIESLLAYSKLNNADFEYSTIKTIESIKNRFNEMMQNINKRISAVQNNKPFFYDIIDTITNPRISYMYTNAVN